MLLKVGEIDGEDLDETRQVNVMLEAIRLNPRAFTAEQTLDAVRRKLEIDRRSYERFGVDGAQQLVTNAHTGEVYAEDIS